MVHDAAREHCVSTGVGSQKSKLTGCASCHPSNSPPGFKLAGILRSGYVERPKRPWLREYKGRQKPESRKKKEIGGGGQRIFPAAADGV
jgi:hypothetical protein